MATQLRSKKLNVLLVDDDRLVAESERQMLERLGHGATVSTDSLEALGMIAQRGDEFDLVITDQIMPKLTGTRLAQEILRVRPSLPVILVTGYSNAVEEVQASAPGIRAVLRKPFGFKELADLIETALDKGRHGTSDES